MNLSCPKCMRSKFVSTVGETHYICVEDPEEEETGCGLQFEFIEDPYIQFPQNMVFANRNKEEFYRKEYIKLKPIK